MAAHLEENKCNELGCRKTAASYTAKFCTACCWIRNSGRLKRMNKVWWKNKCSRPGCGKIAASYMAKFCTACFKSICS